MTATSAVLLGSDHTELGEIAVAGLPPAGAIAISRGKFRKGYPYLDPNEDAVLIATDDTSWLLAVADGHDGFDAARAAIGALDANAAETLAERDQEAAIRDAVIAAHAAVVAAVTDAEDARADSATTLAVALVAGDRLTVGSFGDSMVAVARDDRLRPINRPSPFLDAHADAAATQISRATLAPGDVVLVATDGLIDFLGPGGPKSLARALATSNDPGEIARRGVEHAFAGGAGDNVAVAVLLASAPESA